MRLCAMPEKYCRAWDLAAGCCIAAPKFMHIDLVDFVYLSVQLAFCFFVHRLCLSLIVGADAADQLRARQLHWEKSEGR